MRVPLTWLADYVDISGIEIPEFELRMSMTGTKVESVYRPGAELEGIVVAEVLGIEPHPNADNLSMVEVSTGAETDRVVCGASNFAVGDRVPFARVGSKLPGMEITARKIRGETSKGMLCSGAELGITKDHSGILVLQPDAPLGDDVARLLGLNDTIVEFEITPNRPDCMSVIGIAREVAALWDRSLKIPEAGLQTDALDCPVEIQIDDPEGCPRYLARYLDGVKVGPSPAWMAARLLSVGVRPISNIVDATNYVLMETGQPMHAFDAALVADSKIIVRRASEGETMHTLDGVERKLDPSDLLIADPRRTLALAGVMGGADSEVSENTSTIILECAAFDRVSVAFTSRRHGLRTEASARFEKGTNVEAIPYAAARCARFMKETAGGMVARAEPDAHPVVKERERVTLRPERTTAVLGIEISAERQADLLRKIGVDVMVDGHRIDAEIPPFRGDLEREADLIEEVARLEGFDKLGGTVPRGPGAILTTEQRAVRSLTRTFVAQGMSEAWTSSFFAPADLDRLGLDPEHPARRLVEVSNPMVEQEGALRSTMLPGLLRSLARNVAQFTDGAGLFEIARIYEPTTGDLAAEELALAAVAGGDRLPQSWNGAVRPWDFYAAKGILEAGCKSLGVSGLRYESAARPSAPFHPTRGAVVMLGSQTIGILGELHPEVCHAFDVWESTIVFEVALEPLLNAMPEIHQVEELPRYPSLRIDLAVVVDDRIHAEQVRDLIARAGAPELVAVRLFDLYRGEQVAEGKKSLAFSLEMRDPERTMTDEDAVVVKDRVMNALTERLNAHLR